MEKTPIDTIDNITDELSTSPPMLEDIDTDEEEQGNSITYYENKYEIVTRVAYLCGIQEKYLTEENNFILDICKKLDKHDKPKIVRSLCLIRNSIEHNYSKILTLMRQEARSFYGLKEYYPEEALLYLEQQNIKLPTMSRKLTDMLGEINKAIADRINNCKDYFPTWLNWNYIKELFTMPNGSKPEGMGEEAKKFYSNIAYYPFSTYINWKPKDVGNLFSNDYHFIRTIYEQHNDRMFDTSNLSGVSEDIKNRIYEFINESSKTVLIVDCENADPYSLCAMFKSLDDEQIEKVDKIVLYDDPQAASGWRFFEQHIDVDKEKIEHILIQRILDYKSLLDVKLTARVTKEFYKENVESFVLVSSDSDFWGLMEEIPEAKFLVMIEHRKASAELRKVLDEHDIFYCFADDFYTGMDDSLKKQAIFSEIDSTLDSLKFNAKKLLDDVLVTTRIDMDHAEKQQFYDKHLKNMQLHISKDGDVAIELKK